MASRSVLDASSLTEAPFKALPFKAPVVNVVRRADGTVLLSSAHAQADAQRSIAHLLKERAETFPNRPFLQQRRPATGPWTGYTYQQTKRAADGVAQWLLDAGMGASDAVMVLSGNSLEHAILMLGCYTAGVPVAPVSAAYALMSSDFAKLRHCFDLVRPKYVFVQEFKPFATAIAALLAREPSVQIISADPGDGVLSIGTLMATTPGSAVTEALARLGPATIAKYLFTSGSTGLPKCVPQTQGMMVATLAAHEGLNTRPAQTQTAPAFLEWMPWSHVSAGNVTFNTALFDCGTIFLDEGRPTRDRFEITIKNLYEVSPTKFGSAPIAFAMLAEAMERDPTLRRAFFRNLDFMAYGGAALSNDVYERIQTLSVAETGMRIPLITSFGATETQPVTMVHWQVDRAGLIGLPLPGMTLKLVPNGTKLELRVKGPSVMPGYHGVDGGDAFDEEGYYRLGDAVKFADEADANKGLLFDGRVAEDFKLESGTWVSAGVLRLDIVAACSPLVQDVVVAGQDKAFVACLLWPTAVGLLEFGGNMGLLAAEIARRLTVFNDSAGGSSRRVRRFMVLTDPPSIDAGEITDKGYINQRVALERRRGEVEQLYIEPRHGDVHQVV